MEPRSEDGQFEEVTVQQLPLETSGNSVSIHPSTHMLTVVSLLFQLTSCQKSLYIQGNVYFLCLFVCAFRVKQ